LAGNYEAKEYPNVPPLIGLVVSKKLATLKEIDEYYGMTDILDMVEILTIDAYNHWQQQKTEH